jgi:hypothetical protein
MGGKTKLKNQEKEADLLKKQAALYHGSRKYKEPEPKPALESLINEYHDYFVRPLDNFVLKTKSSNTYKQLLQLVRYAFGKYPVPKILDQAWIPVAERERNLNVGARFDYRKWYICVATGGSLYKTHAKNILTKKEVHNFLNSPSHLSLNQALYYSVAKSAGGTDTTAFRIARSKILEKQFNEFWLNCVRFFAVNCPDSLNDLNDTIDYIAYRHANDNKWSLYGSGYSTNALLKKMHDWHADLRRTKVIGESRWHGHAIDDQTFTTMVNGAKVFWDFKQIKTAKDLAAEGNAMRHCVFGYKAYCANGNLSIWSLGCRFFETDELKRKITIELRNDGRISQARGLANRSVRPDERKVIQAWANKNGLTCQFY